MKLYLSEMILNKNSEKLKLVFFTFLNISQIIIHLKQNWFNRTSLKSKLIFISIFEHP